MTRVLIDGYNLALAKGTGVATYARNLSHELGRMGHQVSVLYGHAGGTPRDPLLREIAFYDEARPRRPGLRDVLRVASPAAPRAVRVPASGHVVTRQFGARLPHHDALYTAPDLFRHAHARFTAFGRVTPVRVPDPVAVAHWTYPLPVRLPGVPNLYTLHDLVPLRLPYTTLDDKRRYLALVRRIARVADHIVTVSECSRRDIIDLLGVSPDRVTNTYQAVALPAALRERTDAAVAREVEGALGVGVGDYFLFWGSIEPKKNVLRLVEAYLASGISTPLVVVGAQAWRADDEMRLLQMAGAARAAGDVRRGRVIQLPYAPFGMLVSLIRGAKAALFPSLYEGFGLPVLEAMQLGTPVLCANTSSLPEVAGQAALSVDPYDAAAICDGIRALDADTDLRDELSRRGVAQAALFSPERYRERLRAVYERVL